MNEEVMNEEAMNEEKTMAGLARGVAKLLEKKQIELIHDDQEELDTSEDCPPTDDLKSIVEAVLFVNEKPIEPIDVSSMLGFDRKEVYDAIIELQNQYEENAKGLRIIKVAGGYQMRTSADTAEWVKSMYKNKFKRKLSNSALEILAIIAYRQPITKMDLEAIRGVDCDGPVRNLLNIGLIKVKGRKDVIGRPFLYGTSDAFLEQFGLNSLKDMPKLEIDESVFALEKLDQGAEEPKEGEPDGTGTVTE